MNELSTTLICWSFGAPLCCNTTYYSGSTGLKRQNSLANWGIVQTNYSWDPQTIPKTRNWVGGRSLKLSWNFRAFLVYHCNTIVVTRWPYLKKDLLCYKCVQLNCRLNSLLTWLITAVEQLQHLEWVMRVDFLALFLIFMKFLK